MDLYKNTFLLHCLLDKYIGSTSGNPQKALEDFLKFGDDLLTMDNYKELYEKINKL